MKHNLRNIVSTVFAVACVGICVAATTAVVLPDYTFTSAVVIPISNSDLQPSYLTAIEMSFGTAQANTCQLIHTRDGVEHILVAATDTMKTLTWYPPRPLFLKDGDSLTLTNSVAVEAYLNLSTEKYKN